MAGYSSVGVATRIVLLLLLVLVLAAGGLVWFDYLGLVDAKEVLGPVLELAGIRKPTTVENVDDPFLLDRERLQAREEALRLREAKLDERELQIKRKEAEIQQMQDEIAEQRRSLEEQQKSINDRLKSYEDKETNLRDISNKLVGMPPADAIEVLLQMKDVEVIDIIRMTDKIAAEQGNASMTSKWLSDMPAERAAAISEKMLLKSP